MDREVNLDELLQQRLSRRDLFRNAGVAGIGLSGLLDLAWQPSASHAQAPATAKVGAQLAYNLSRKWGIFTPQARFGFVREFRNDAQEVTVRFANDLFVGTPGEPDSGFVVVTDEPDENYFNWAVGFSATFANGFSGLVDYESR